MFFYGYVIFICSHLDLYMSVLIIIIAAFMTDRQQEYELSGFQPNFRYFGQRLCSPTTQRSVQQIEPNFVDVEAKHRPLYRYDLLLYLRWH